MHRRRWLVVLSVVCLAAAAANLLIARIIAQRIRATAIRNSRKQGVFAPHSVRPRGSAAGAARSGNTGTPSKQKRGGKRDGGERDGLRLRK
ncbi:MAG: hypothetical protein DRP63_03055 [Planctomycetota bacterium]|nr:MAG: hypothetical protein DRP63_03055 [Planctomycetota bacterium]